MDGNNFGLIFLTFKNSCLFKCAILSPAFKVREFSVTDAVPFPISLVWNHDSEETEGYVAADSIHIPCHLILVWSLGVVG
jgi:hypothetical protein